jgi:chaperone modulatory protein CbpM
MKPLHTNCFSLDDSETVTLTELSQCCAMSLAELEELVDYSALTPLPSSPQPTFSARWVTPLRAASKLRQEFDLDVFTVALVVGHLNRIEILENQVRSLMALLPPELRLSLGDEGPTRPAGLY